MPAEDAAPDPSADATLSPRAVDPPKTLGPSDPTVRGSAEAIIALPAADDTKSILGHDATLGPPAETAATLSPHAAATLPPTASVQPPTEPQPTDATLDPNDPRVKAYHEAALHAAESGGSRPAIATGASFGDYELI